MSDIRSESIEKPLDQPKIARQVISAIDKANAMGFIVGEPHAYPTSVSQLKKALVSVEKAGIGKNFFIATALSAKKQPQEFLEALTGFNKALEDSPNPESEWERLENMLGVELLCSIVDISKVSLSRYRSKQRETPTDIAAKLHYTAMLIADLLGSYNELGIRNWFNRKRFQLENRSPRQILKGEWTPDDEPAKKIKALAQSLSGSPAT